MGRAARARIQMGSTHSPDRLKLPTYKTPIHSLLVVVVGHRCRRQPQYARESLKCLITFARAGPDREHHVIVVGAIVFDLNITTACTRSLTHT